MLARIRCNGREDAPAARLDPPVTGVRVGAFLNSQNHLTGNQMVPYCNYGTKWFPIEEMNDDAVFKALADASRRELLDRLRHKNGQTLGELRDGLNMTRQAVAKHLGILRKANLVSWKREGRERFHFINPVPINEIAERWISKFDYPRLQALSRLKRNLEGKES
jgi:DNA-binding transcriptional ArsR family regulator